MSIKTVKDLRQALKPYNGNAPIKVNKTRPIASITPPPSSANAVKGVSINTISVNPPKSAPADLQLGDPAKVGAGA